MTVRDPAPDVDPPEAGVATAEPSPTGAGDGREHRATTPGPGSVPDDEDAPVAVAAQPVDESVDFRMALVSSVTLDLPSQHPSVVLREIDTPRRQLTFAIGMPDAVSLSHAHRRIPTPRPLTHELMSEALQDFDIDVVAVRIVGRTGSVYFAELVLRGRTGRSVLSCRPSDALTLALHQPVQAPILIDARLLEDDGDVSPPGTAD
jgi:bifunctional DNase/RNase